MPPALTWALPERSLSPTLPVKPSYFHVLRVGELIERVNRPSSAYGGVGGNAVAKLHVEPGTYKLTVKPGDDYMVKGGFGFDLEISGGPAADVAGAPVAKADGDAAPVAAAGGELGEQVAMLNELCPDTFCEGDYQYSFKKLDCVEATKCVLSFDAKDLKGKSFAAQVPVVGFKSLNDEEATFVGAVSESLMKWESLPTNMKTVAMANPGKAPAKAAAKPAKKK